MIESRENIKEGKEEKVIKMITIQVSWILILTIWSIKLDFGAANFDVPSFEAAFQGN